MWQQFSFKYCTVSTVLSSIISLYCIAVPCQPFTLSRRLEESASISDVRPLWRGAEPKKQSLRTSSVDLFVDEEGDQACAHRGAHSDGNHPISPPRSAHYARVRLPWKPRKTITPLLDVFVSQILAPPLNPHGGDGNDTHFRFQNDVQLRTTFAVSSVSSG